MKKSIIIASAILGSGLIIASLFVFKDSIFHTSSVTSPQPVVEEKKELELWNDQAGFSFTYQKGILINPHDEDKDNYAHLELTNASHTGRIIIWAKDSLYEDIATWTAKDVSLQGSSIIDSTLGGKPAKKIVLTTPVKKMIIGTIDDQILFTIEVELQEGDTFWQDVYTTIVESFTFIPFDTPQVNSDINEDSGSSFDEEEVLE